MTTVAKGQIWESEYGERRHFHILRVNRKTVSGEDAKTGNALSVTLSSLQERWKLIVPSRLRKVHALKAHPEPFDAIWYGDKHHEIRKDDRGYQVGDHLLLRRWDPLMKKYTGKKLRVEVTHKTPGGQWGLPEGICVMSIAHVHTSGDLCCAVHKRSHYKRFVSVES